VKFDIKVTVPFYIVKPCKTDTGKQLCVCSPLIFVDQGSPPSVSSKNH
jgi:hypothetical protein